MLASRKVIYCEVNTEGSGTAKSGTDRQEPDMRPAMMLLRTKEQAGWLGDCSEPYPEHYYYR